MTEDIFDTDLGELPTIAVNDRYEEFSVSKPMKVGSIIMYEVAGYDKDGAFCENKRYSDFDKLRTILSVRWPGFFIPAIQPKQAFVS